MPNLRPQQQPQQQPNGMPPQRMPSTDNANALSHYQRQMAVQQQQQAASQHQQQQQKAPLTPYQQQQMMLQYTRGAPQQQQPIQPQNTGGQQQFIAPQHSGSQQQQQIGGLVPQHSGQQQQQQPQVMMNGFGGAGPGPGMNGINPAMLAQQQQFQKQQQQQMQAGAGMMMNGVNVQIPPRPGTAMGGNFNPQQQQQQQPPVPPSPALSAASQSRGTMGPPSVAPLQRAHSQIHDSPSPHHQQGGNAMSPQAPNPNPDASRPMSRMSSSGGGQPQQQPGWNNGAGVGGPTPQPQMNGFPPGVDPRTLNRPGGGGMPQQQRQSFGPASAATLQGHHVPQPQPQPQPQQLQPQQQQQFQPPRPGPLSNQAANAQQMAMMQRAHAKSYPTPQEVFQQLNPQQQQHFLAMPQQQQQQQMQVLQMRLMQQRQQRAAVMVGAEKPGVVGGGPPGLQQHQHPQQHPNVHPAAGPVHLAAQQQQQQQPVPPQIQQQHAPPPPLPPQPQQPRDLLPPHLQGKVDHRMVVVKPLPYVKDEDDVTHGGALPQLTDREIERVRGWLEKDKAYIRLVEEDEKNRKPRNAKELLDAAGVPRWFETDVASVASVPPGQKLTVLWPNEKKKQRRVKTGRAETRFPLEYPPGATDTPEELVPIRLEVEFEQYRLRDTFVWNVNDPVVTPEKFAQTTCEDFALPGAMGTLIAKQIQEQLSEYKAVDLPRHVAMFELDDDPVVKGVLEEKEERWWDGWKSKVVEGEVKMEQEQDVVVDVDVDVDVKDVAASAPELRIMIKLDIMIGPKHLVDQFEWDITETMNSPEMFAAQYASELSLGGEFTTAIAHDIREQVNMYQRALIAVGHNFDGGTIFDDDLRQALLPPVTIAGRTSDQAANCMPVLNIMSEGEMENNEKEREKELKRKKRQGRGRRGMILPDREPLKTHRTLPGCADVAALLPAAPAPVSVPSRRQAAVNASQTIASLVAQENNNGYTPVVHTPTRGDSGFLAPPTSSSTPSGSGSGADKGGRANKRQKTGHVNAPGLPESVYRPRARMDATYAPPSTGVKPPPKTQERIQADNEARENERAKLPEWHCSTCGCPDAIAVGRRKGPKGDKSQCGPCGKYYHRYRRTKDVEYNPDPEFHLRLRQQELERKKRKRPVKKGRTESLALDNANSPAPQDDDDDDDDDDDHHGHGHTPSARKKEVIKETTPPPPPSKRARSVSSSPSPPLAATKKERESPLTPLPPPPPSPLPPPSTPTSATAPVIPIVNVIPPPPSSLPRPQLNPDAPEWMQRCLAELQVKYKDDRFGPIIRPVQTNSTPGAPREWRIKCYDCPGKVYTPGPEETLSNFEVHLKNKRHRDNVNARLGKERGGSGPVVVNGAPNGPPPPPPAAAPATS